MGITASELAGELTIDDRPFINALRNAGAQWNRFGDSLEASSKKFGNVLSTALGVSLSNLVTSATRGLVGLGKAVIDVGSDFESAFAGVKKTVDATAPQLDRLRQGILDMAKEIPASASEIAKVAESAGQLGIKTENILGFTRVMIDLGNSTNLSADQAATALARLANITQLPQDQFDELGSTIVALGNNLATTEAEIVEMGLRLAGAGAQVKLTEAQILGFAGALSSVGIEAEAGGTAFSRVMLNMQAATKAGGQELATFARIAGVSVSQFKQQFQTDAAGAIVTFVEGIKRMSDQGANLLPILKEIDLGEIRVRDALLRTANAGDLLRNSVQLGTKAWQENTALTKEATERYKTFDSQLTLLYNALKDVAIQLFDKARPALMSIVKTVGELIPEISRLAGSFADLGKSATGGVADANRGFDDFLVGVRKLALGFGAAFDSITTTLSAAVVTIVAGVKQIYYAITLQFDEVLRVGEQWKTDMAALWDNYTSRSLERNREYQKILLQEEKTAYDRRLQAAFEAGGSHSKAWLDGFSRGDTAGGVNQKIKNALDSLVQQGGTANKTGESLGGITLEGFTRKLDLFNSTKQEIQSLTGLQPLAFTSGASIGQQLKRGWDSKTKQSPFFIIHDIEDSVKAVVQAAPKMESAGKAVADGIKKGVGKGARTIFDEFEAGFAGLEKAIDLTAENLGRKDLFGAIGKKAAPAVQKIKEAATEAAKAVEEFFNEMGVKIKVTEERLLKLAPSIGKPILQSVKGFEKLKDAIEEVNFKRVADGFAALDTNLTLTNKAAINLNAKGFNDLIVRTKEIGISFNTFKALPLEVIKNLEKLGFTFKTAFTPDISREIQGITEASKEQARVMPVWAAIIESSVKDGGKALAWLVGIQRAMGEDLIEGIEYTRAKSAEAFAKPFFDAAKMKQQMDKLKDLVGDGMAAVVAKFGAVFGQTLARTTEVTDGLLQIIGNLPGKFGDKLRGVTDKVITFVNQIDGILKGLHKIFDSIPDGLGGLISAITGIFKKAQSPVGDAVGGVGTVIVNAVQKAMGGAKQAVAQGTQDITAGVSGFASAVGGIFSALTQAVGVFASTFHDESKAVRFAGGFLLGGPIGGILSAIFGGPSQHEKTMMRLKEEKAELENKVIKEGLKKAMQETVQSALQTVRDALETFRQLEDFVKIPNATINRFFSNLRLLLKRFVDLSGMFSSELLHQAKNFGEKLQPGIQLMGGALQVFAQMQTFVAPAEEAIVKFFASLKSVVDKFGVLADEVPDKIEKKVKRFATRMQPMADLLAPAIEGITKLFDFKPINAAALDQFAASFETLVRRLGDVAGKIDNAVEREVQRFSDRVSGVAGLISGAVDAFKALAEYAGTSRLSHNLKLLLNDFEIALRSIAQIGGEIGDEMMTAAQNTANKSLVVFEAIKSAFESLTAISKYEGVPTSVFNAIKQDFSNAMYNLSILLAGSDIFRTAAEKFRDTIIAAVNAFRQALDYLGGVQGVPAPQFATAGISPQFATASSSSLAASSAQIQIQQVSVTVDAKDFRTQRQVDDYIADLASALKKRRGQ